MVVQHNIPALNSYRNLGINNSNLAKNLEKLSSGYRINRAGDDAAGLAISEKMRGQIRGLGMAEQNAENGISLIQTAEGGLNETHDILQRMRELAVQSSNGTYQDEDRAQIELEYQALKQEIDRIASYTNYNGIKLLDGTVGGVMLSNTDAATKITGAEADVLTDSLGIATGMTFGTVTFGADSDGDTTNASVTASDKTMNYSYAATDAIDGFDEALEDGVFAATNADTTLADDVSGTTRITLTKGDSGWNASIDTEVEGLKITSASFDEATTTITFETEGGGEYTINWGAFDADNVGNGDNSAANAGGYAAGSTIYVDANLVFDTAGTVDSMSVNYGTVTGETVDYKTGTAGGVSSADLSFSWDAENEVWNVTGSGIVVNSTTTPTISETATFEGVIEPGSNAAKVVATLKDGQQIELALTAANFEAPGEADLSAAKFTASYDGTNLKVDPGSVEAYKYDSMEDITPDKVRADRMLAAMGISNASKFDINAALETGTTEEKALWESLNGKDAYIITRDSTADADRNVYNADSQFETILQVNGESYHGTLEGGDMVFRTDDGLEVAKLTMASEAVETGTVRFNIGDKYKSDGVTENEYYDSFLINKEGAQIGSENQAEMVFQIGANGTEDQRVGMYVLNMSSDNLGNHAKGNFVADSSISTRDQANIAVDTLDHAINYVSSQRANLGALQNRLEHTLNNLGVTKENLTAAESSIRDTDMAEEMMEFTKNNILSQASQAMLAQANQLPQGVLQLLG